MSDSALTRERTITVETGGLGAVRVRRMSLGGIARIAQRLRDEGVHDEQALGEALVSEVVIAGIGSPGDDPAAAPAPVDAARLALLSDEDRRSIAAAVLTLEGVKAAGEDVREDPRTILARRFARVLDTRRVAPVDEAAATAPEVGAGAAAPVASAQMPLFEGLLPPPDAATLPAGATLAPDATRQGPPSRAWERERARLEADVADLEALLAQQAEQREALEAREAAAAERARAAERAARRYRLLAGGALALLVVVLGAQFAWIGMLRNDLAEQRAEFDERLRAQQQALEQAKRTAAEATARADRLAAQRLLRPAPTPAPARPAAPSTRPPTSSARPSASPTQPPASKTPAAPQRRP